MMSKIYNLSNRLSRVFADHSPLTTHHSNQRGAILITMLLLMVIVTLLGVIAINTSTIDIQITGYSKRAAQALQGAEAGVDLSIPIIENTIAAGALTPANFTISGNTITPNSTLEAEILNDQAAAVLSTFDTPADISIADIGQGVAVNIDIDRMYSFIIAGGALEFASGYEGIGAGAAGGGIGVLYKINSQGTK